MDLLTWWILLGAAIVAPLLAWYCWRSWRRRDVPPALVLVVGTLAGLVLVDVACLPQREAAERDLAAALQRTTAAVDSFSAWDKQHQAELVKGSKTREEAQGKLDAYRVQRRQTVAQIKAAAESIGAAVTALDGSVMPPPQIGAAGGVR